MNYLCMNFNTRFAIIYHVNMYFLQLTNFEKFFY